MLLTAMLEESTQKHSSEDISNMLERLGSDVSFSAGDNEIVMNISSLKQNLDSTLKIAEEMLFMPKFDQEDFDLVKKEQLDNIANQATQAASIANNVFVKLIHGTESNLSLPVMGNTETVSSITLDDVKEYYKNFSAYNSVLAISGDIDQATAVKKMGFLNKLQSANTIPQAKYKLHEVDKTRLYFVDKKGAPQSEIRIGAMSLPYDATDEFFKSNIMNFSFAGAFNSRINVLLREVRGFTYGTRGAYTGNKFAGPYVISGGFRANATDSSLVDLLGELKKYSEGGITAEELEFTKNAMAQSDALKYESPFQKLGFIKRIVDYNLDKTFVAKQGEILKTITKEEINALAAKNLPPQKNMVILVVGDKASNYDKLSKLGYEMVELDVNGNPVK